MEGHRSLSRRCDEASQLSALLWCHHNACPTTLFLYSKRPVARGNDNEANPQKAVRPKRNNVRSRIITIEIAHLNNQRGTPSEYEVESRLSGCVLAGTLRKSGLQHCSKLVTLTLYRRILPKQSRRGSGPKASVILHHGLSHGGM